MPQPVKPPHQPAGHRQDLCRICCRTAKEAGPVCRPRPGNPQRPFLYPRTAIAILRKEPIEPGTPICSAPPDDDPATNHILACINKLTPGCNPLHCPEPAWKVKLAATVAKLLPQDAKARTAQEWAETSRQTLYEDGLIIENSFRRCFIVGCHLVKAETEDEGRTAVVTLSNWNRIRLRPSRRARQFAAAVNEYARPG